MKFYKDLDSNRDYVLSKDRVLAIQGNVVWIEGHTRPLRVAYIDPDTFKLEKVKTNFWANEEKVLWMEEGRIGFINGQIIGF